MTMNQMQQEVQRLEKRHSARLLDHLGAKCDAKMKADIKRAFRWFSEDVEQSLTPTSVEKSKETCHNGRKEQQQK